LFERDCSLQRRHQKVIEEAPAPGMDAETREAVCGAAVRAAQAVNYENAGTIEFIADASEGLRRDRIWFMEMNTRLQVEHPVTEEITGQDLVEWQLRVASGEPLPLMQDELSITGHAIEARLYAEDPAKGFLPSVGKLERFEIEDDVGVRLDSGFTEGDVISPYYDPMIAKIICSSCGGTADATDPVAELDRATAVAKLAPVLRDLEVWPVKTNAGFLLNALSHKDFASGRIDTGFIERNLDELVPDPEPDDLIWRGAAMVAMAEDEESAPFNSDLDGFRLNSGLRLSVALGRGGAFRTINQFEYPMAAVTGFRDGDRVVVFYEGTAYEFDLASRGTGQSHGIHDGEIEAPMPGKVTAVEVQEGDKVAKGQRLLTLEAMKMEHALTAPFDGTVAELSATTGAQVTEGQLLVKVEAAE
jgi:3-methylcrotonyl-CoA carboxylase alpha subunit